MARKKKEKMFRPVQMDENDFPTPYGIFMDIMIALSNEMNIDWDAMIDGCATPENKKFHDAFTPEFDALSVDWSKEKTSMDKYVKFVWLAVPYKRANGSGDFPQPKFVEKACEQALKGVITIALIQPFKWERWYNTYITKNDNCHEIILIERVKYPGMKVPFGKGNALVIFGVKKGSISEETEDIISELPSKYNKKNGKKNSLYTLPVKTEEKPAKPKKKKRAVNKTGKRSYIKSGLYTKEALAERKALAEKNKKTSILNTKKTRGAGITTEEAEKFSDLWVRKYGCKGNRTKAYFECFGIKKDKPSTNDYKRASLLAKHPITKKKAEDYLLKNAEALIPPDTGKNMSHAYFV